MFSFYFRLNSIFCLFCNNNYSITSSPSFFFNKNPIFVPKNILFALNNPEDADVFTISVTGIEIVWTLSLRYCICCCVFGIFGLCYEFFLFFL